ncbi:uncharacterized protein KY384_008040 [Bacidia gigantensis]|uniref:uncharacterized protein n=1 Tax=Bacidia gigantensis TaxID=2732470 RepID=UPI001D058577|nr:uncharacterized protein KY384_008040 [Bacidia gigantensis]KAG8527296.1 hypothetical protein KY384_008040 [Bacidia gigantensis]
MSMYKRLLEFYAPTAPIKLGWLRSWFLVTPNHEPDVWRAFQRWATTTSLEVAKWTNKTSKKGEDMWQKSVDLLCRLEVFRNDLGIQANFEQLITKELVDIFQTSRHFGWPTKATQNTVQIVINGLKDYEQTAIWTILMQEIIQALTAKDRSQRASYDQFAELFGINKAFTAHVVPGLLEEIWDTMDAETWHAAQEQPDMDEIDPNNRFTEIVEDSVSSGCVESKANRGKSKGKMAIGSDERERKSKAKGKFKEIESADEE